MVVVYDKQPSGSLPVFSDIFGHTPPTGVEASAYLDAQRYDNTDRFRILRDKVIRMDINSQNTAAAGAAVTVDRYPFDEFIKLSLETNFSGQTSPQTISDISSGALYVIFRVATVGASAADNDVAISPNSFARLRYTDI